MAASYDNKLLGKRKEDKYGSVSYEDERWRENDALGQLQKARNAGCVLAEYLMFAATEYRTSSLATFLTGTEYPTPEQILLSV